MLHHLRWYVECALPYCLLNAATLSYMVQAQCSGAHILLYHFPWIDSCPSLKGVIHRLLMVKPQPLVATRNVDEAIELLSRTQES